MRNSGNVHGQSVSCVGEGVKVGVVAVGEGVDDGGEVGAGLEGGDAGGERLGAGFGGVDRGLKTGAVRKRIELIINRYSSERYRVIISSCKFTYLLSMKFCVAADANDAL